MGSSLCSGSAAASSVSTHLELDVERQRVRARARHYEQSQGQTWQDNSPSPSASEPGMIQRSESPPASSWSTAAAATAASSGNQLILLLERCTGVPVRIGRSLNCSCNASSTPIRNRLFVIAAVRDSDGTLLGQQVKWPVRSNTRSPTWFSARPLGAADLLQHPNAQLVLEVWDGKMRVGSLSTPLTSLPVYRDETLELQLDETYANSSAVLVGADASTTIDIVHTSSSSATSSANPAGTEPETCSITFQVLDAAGLSFGSSRTVYFVRHGESLWNEAQSRGWLREMAAELDHPLSIKGAEQAERLRRKIEAGVEKGDKAAVQLSSPGVLYVSPLCRAVQTGLLALGPSQVATGGELVLMATAREKQNFGGFDSMSKRRGVEILRGTVEGMKRLYGQQDAKFQETLNTFKNLKFDVHEAEEEWWCEGNSDSPENLRIRIQDFMAQILYTPHEVAVVVGHSHFFRSVLKSCLSEEFIEENPELSKEITTKKLMNCGVVRVDLNPRLGIEGKPIVGVELVLGTTLEKDGSLGELVRGCCVGPADLAAEEKSTLVVPPGSPPGSPVPRSVDAFTNSKQ